LKTLSDPQCKQEILSRVRKVRADSPRQWGKMNAAQMICHLNDSFLCAMGERPVPIDPKFRARRLAKWVALRAPFRWPHGVKTRPEIDQQAGGGTPPADFEVDRELLLYLVERFTAKLPDFKFAPHPMFPEMNEREWMRWGYLHADHHLRQFGA
jgi:hypothetical protein